MLLAKETFSHRNVVRFAHPFPARFIILAETRKTFFTAKKNCLTETLAGHVCADGIRSSFSQWVTPQKVQPLFC